MDYFVEKSVIARHFNLKEEMLGDFVIVEYRSTATYVCHLGILLKIGKQKDAFIDLHLGKFAQTYRENGRSCKIFAAQAGSNGRYTLAENCANETRVVWNNKEFQRNFFWYQTKEISTARIPVQENFFAFKEFYSRKFNIPLRLMVPVILKYVQKISLGYAINDSSGIAIDIAKATAVKTGQECSCCRSASDFSIHGQSFGTDEQGISFQELAQTYATRWAF